jgi:hypothetical protein
MLRSRLKPLLNCEEPCAGAATVTLTDAQADAFEELLRAVTLERHDVRRVMGFALDHALAAADVVETLVESLTLAETPFPSKVRGGSCACPLLLRRRLPCGGGGGGEARAPDRVVHRCNRVAIRDARDSGWEIAHAAVSRRPPIPLPRNVARTESYTYAANRESSLVQGPFSCRPEPKPQTFRSATYPP